MNLTLVDAAATPTLNVDAAKLWLRLDHTVEDALISDLVSAVERRAERFGLVIGSKTWDYRLDRFPSVIRLPRGPVTSVTGIYYIDTDGTTQTLAASQYDVDVFSLPARLVPAYGESWPVARTVPNAVRVRFVSGYDLEGATPNPLPYDLLQALRMALWDAYYCRGDSERVEGAIDTVLGRYTVYA